MTDARSGRPTTSPESPHSLPSAARRAPTPARDLLAMVATLRSAACRRFAFPAAWRARRRRGVRRSTAAGSRVARTPRPPPHRTGDAREPLATRARRRRVVRRREANATSTDANGSTVDPPTSRYARTCADPGAKLPRRMSSATPTTVALAATSAASDGPPRASWRSTPPIQVGGPSPPTPTGAWRTADWRARVPAHLHLPPAPPQLLSVAPMMDYTTPHFRVLCRLLSRRTWLYTEMEVDQTLVHTDHPRLDRFLDFPLSTHPSVLQLGGSDPETLARATAVAAPYGYDEINLNCGCPSPKVAGKGSFGAAMMLEPTLVAECVAAMAENAGGAPVTVKCRIGVDDVDSHEDARRFVEVVARRASPRAERGRSSAVRRARAKSAARRSQPRGEPNGPPPATRVGARVGAGLPRRRIRAQRRRDDPRRSRRDREGGRRGSVRRTGVRTCG